MMVKRLSLFAILTLAAPFLLSCAQVDVPGTRGALIPSPTIAEPRPEAVNEKPDSVLYLPLGSDVLVPQAQQVTPLPSVEVGPFELRSETLAGALQLILADYDVPLAFETDEGLTRTITVAKLSGPLGHVVERVCGLANLYCAYEDGILVVKDTQIFTVTVPPVGGDIDILGAMATGIQAITGSSPITEEGTRTIIYEATNRTARLAERYFQRIRSNTALIVFEVYIWEVTLDTSNNLGIDWTNFGNIGGADISIPGGFLSGPGGETPISIGLPSLNGGDTFGADNVLQFISTYGAVKTISQPLITVLSGSEATLRAADTENFVSSLSRSVDDGEVTISTETDSVDTGFTLTIASAWDNATIYGNIDIELQEIQGFADFDAEGTVLRLPQTTERELSTQIRVRPGDALLIAGLVRESDEFDKSGPGFDRPLFPSSRGETVSNTELVMVMKPRVIVYTENDGSHAAQNAGLINVPSRNPALGSDPSSVPQAEVFPVQDSFPEGSLSPELLNPSR